MEQGLGTEGGDVRGRKESGRAGDIERDRDRERERGRERGREGGGGGEAEVKVGNSVI